jgi:hypothetical protein
MAVMIVAVVVAVSPGDEVEQLAVVVRDDRQAALCQHPDLGQLVADRATEVQRQRLAMRSDLRPQPLAAQSGCRCDAAAGRRSPAVRG